MGSRRHSHRRRRGLGVGLGTALVVLALGGCSLSQTLRPQSYTVRRGDNLYSIAQRYRIDWHDLARWNAIAPPYRIDVGQRLTLEPYPPLDYNRMPTQARGARPRVVRAPQDSRAAQQRSIQAATPQLKRTIEPRARAASGKPAEQARPRPPAQSRRADNNADRADDARIRSTSQARATTPVQAGGPAEDGWQWPASGAIVRAYQPDKGRQGVEIGGRVGAPVYAASSGKVVYDGSGLKGYGKLVIIKHDKHFLSAYGFNRRTLVKQGENVAAGTHIADMGLGPENKPMLHFEIRHDGSPIDPESVLPEH